MTTELEALRAAVAKGVDMRAAQVAFFKGKRPYDLETSKALEHEFDAMAAELKRGYSAEQGELI